MLVIHLLIILPCFCVVFSSDLLIKTSQGLIQGHFNEAGIREWKGIPYANSPEGSLRWEYPQPFSSSDSSSVYEANFNAPGCPQDCKLPPGNCPAYGTSENCLFLSVFAPKEQSADKNGYPVLFWIHGGAFEQGLGNCALYNGTTFANNNVVTVVINYRLGALGFLASKSMKGNFGIMDQRLALQWTKTNIGGFGGDPNKITIAGQSAGAMSVGAHLISPNSKGLFSNAIMESNPIALPFHTRETAGKNADDMFAYMDCAPDDLACARAKPVESVIDAQNNAIKLDFNTLLLNFMPFTPMVEEGGEIPEQPMEAFRGGRFQQVNLLSGSMTDEGQLFVFELFPKPLSEAAYKVVVDGVFGTATGRKILSKYPYDIVPGSTDGRQALNVLATDLIFYCPLRNVTTGFQKSLGVSAIPTYIYRFKHVMSFDCWGPDYAFCVGSVCHGSELPFVFNCFNDGETVFYSPTNDELALSKDLVSAWSNFVTNGDPNKGIPVPRAYPLYKSEEDVLIVLDEPDSDTQSHVRDSFCDLWDTLGYYY